MISLLFYIFASLVVLARLFGVGLLTLKALDDSKIELDINYGCEFFVICIGFLEAISMFEITKNINKQEQIANMNVNEARRIEDAHDYRLKIVKSITMVVLFSIVVAYAVMLILYSVTNVETYERTINNVTIIILITVTIGLSCVYAPMQKKLSELPGTLKTRKLFRSLFFIFLMSYLLQAVAFIFIMTGKCQITSYVVIFVSAILDLIPIHCVLYLHRSTVIKDADELPKKP